MSGPLGRLATLSDLPVEVLQLIASDLDRETGAVLARTCRNTRETGEALLYRDVNITSGYDSRLGVSDGGQYTEHTGEQMVVVMRNSQTSSTTSSARRSSMRDATNSAGP